MLDNIKTAINDYREFYTRAESELSDLVNGYENKDFVYAGAAVVLLYIEGYSRLIGHDLTENERSNALLVGGLIDPYDSAIDSSSIDEAIASCKRYFELLGFGNYKPRNQNEEAFYALYNRLTERLPEDSNPNFYKILGFMTVVELIANLQRTGSHYLLGQEVDESRSPLNNEQLMKIMQAKGGVALMLLGSLIDLDVKLVGDIDYGQLAACPSMPALLDSYDARNDLFVVPPGRSAMTYLFGSYTQNMDDIGDMAQDKKKGYETFSRRVGFVQSLRNALHLRKELKRQLLRYDEKEVNAYLEFADLYLYKGILWWAKGLVDKK
ncbi:MAG: hypothetical protein V1859_09845 [archaeon]